MTREMIRANHADLAAAERSFNRSPTDRNRAALLALLAVDPACECSIHRGLRKRKLI